MSEDSAAGKDALPIELYRTLWYLIEKKNYKNNKNNNYFTNSENNTRRN